MILLFTAVQHSWLVAARSPKIDTKRSNQCIPIILLLLYGYGSSNSTLIVYCYSKTHTKNDNTRQTLAVVSFILFECLTTLCEHLALILFSSLRFNIYTVHAVHTNLYTKCTSSVWNIVVCGFTLFCTLLLSICSW